MIQRLIDAITAKGAPVVVGLDPQESFIPAELVEEAKKNASSDDPREILAEAFFLFNKGITDAVCDLVPAVKPQSAMYERLGTAGVACYERTVRYCKEKGLIVIGDVKRGDIGSTSAAYAAGHLGSSLVLGQRVSAFDTDFATVNPYLGSDGILPFVKACKEEDRGIFVLVKTSNPSSGEFQDVPMEDGRPLYEHVGEKVALWGREAMDGNYSDVCAVVGATYPEQAKVLRALMPNTYILAPGYGAQGGTAKDLTAFFNPDGLGCIVNSSRGIIAAWQKEAYRGLSYAEAARKASADMIADIRGALAQA